MTVHVRLENVNYHESGESHPYRDLELNATNNYSIRIGRGSRSGSKDLYPAENNAWFESRVMSREHAVLKAHLASKTITIEDVGSMHGTYVDDVKLSKYQPKHIHDESTMVFGAEVSRGPGKQRNQWGLDLSHFIALNESAETFPALEIDIFYRFDDDHENINPAEGSRPTKNTPADIITWSGNKSEEDNVARYAASQVSRNSFSVPDYDSDDYDSETEHQVREPAQKVEVIIQPREVEDSDFSNGGSVMSDDDDEAIPLYEPWNQTYCNTFQASEPQSSGIPKKLHKTEAPETQPEGRQADQPSASFGGKVQTGQAVQAVSQLATSQTIELDTDSGDEESDYGDNTSDDLFDDDVYAESPMASKKMDNSSLSSQSPILTSMPSEIELAAHHPAVKEPINPISPQSPVVADTPIKPAQSSNLGVPEAPRAPSPSDAAMAKARAATPYPFNIASQYVVHENETTGLPGSSMSNPFSVDNDTVNSQGSGFMHTCGYAPSMSMHVIQDTYPIPYANTTDYWPTSQPQYYQSPVSPLAYDWNYGPMMPKAAEPAPKTLEPSPAQAPASSFVTLKATPRVAIKDLVDQTEPLKESATKPRFVPYSAHSRPSDPDVDMVQSLKSDYQQGMKRKADQMTQDVPLDSALKPLTRSDVYFMEGTEMECALAEEQDAQVIEPATAATNSQPETIPMQPLSETEDSAPGEEIVAVQKRMVELQNQAADVRPTKKARNSLYKYAATAVGGIAVGAIGAVAALVTLPPDFFV